MIKIANDTIPHHLHTKVVSGVETKILPNKIKLKLWL